MGWLDCGRDGSISDSDSDSDSSVDTEFSSSSSEAGVLFWLLGASGSFSLSTLSLLVLFASSLSTGVAVFSWDCRRRGAVDELSLSEDGSSSSFRVSVFFGWITFDF